MGFRSTFVSEELNIEWPEWFVRKYNYFVVFTDDRIGQICSKNEYKMYSDEFEYFYIDIQRAIEWDFIKYFVLVFLHECGGITRCQISKDAIKFSEPTEWIETGGITHNYCYGCSDI